MGRLFPIQASHAVGLRMQTSELSKNLKSKYGSKNSVKYKKSLSARIRRRGFEAVKIFGDFVLTSFMNGP